MLKPRLRERLTVTILTGVAVSMIFSIAATTQSSMLFHKAYAQPIDNYCFETSTDVNCYPTLQECQQAQSDREFFDPDVIITNDCRFVGGQAKPTTFNNFTPFESSGTPLCGGEEVAFSGTIHTVGHMTQGPDGRFQITVDHLNFQRTTATGLVSGTKYVINEADNTVVNERYTSPNTLVIQSIVNGQLIGQGTATNTVIHLTFHLTINANGQETASVENVNTQCT